MVYIRHESICTTSEKFENATLCLRLGLPCALIRHELTELFRNDLQTAEICKRRLVFFVCTENISKRRFLKTIPSQSPYNFPNLVFLKHKSKMTGDCCILNSPGVVWAENIRWVFRVKPPIVNSSGVVWGEAIRSGFDKSVKEYSTMPIGIMGSDVWLKFTLFQRAGRGA